MCIYSSQNCLGINIVVVLLVLVKICHIMTQRCFMLCTTYTNCWYIICPLEVNRCLTPLSKIFQLLLLWRKLEYTEKSTDLSHVTYKRFIEYTTAQVQLKWKVIVLLILMEFMNITVYKLSFHINQWK